MLDEIIGELPDDHDQPEAFGRRTSTAVEAAHRGLAAVPPAARAPSGVWQGTAVPVRPRLQAS